MTTRPMHFSRVNVLGERVVDLVLREAVETITVTHRKGASFVSSGSKRQKTETYSSKLLAGLLRMTDRAGSTLSNSPTAMAS